MQNWVLPSLAALIFWGIWGFLPKMASFYLNPKSILIYQFLGHFLVMSSLLVSLRFRPDFHFKGFLFSALAGLAASLGTLFFLYALQRGKASVVVTITALYPLITIILSLIILQEKLGLSQIIGVCFSIIALICFFR